VAAGGELPAKFGCGYATLAALVADPSPVYFRFQACPAACGVF
jgi:hypothetical protein